MEKAAHAAVATFFAVATFIRSLDSIVFHAAVLKLVPVELAALGALAGVLGMACAPWRWPRAGSAASALAFAAVKFHADQSVPLPALPHVGVAVVTGANSGIGLQVVRLLAEERPRHVVAACRSGSRCQSAIGSLQGAKGRLTPLGGLDLCDLARVRDFVGSLKSALEGQQIDLLVNNAGHLPVGNGSTPQGYEEGLGCMHLGHLAFTKWLVDSGMLQAGAQVVQVSSVAMYLGSFHTSLFAGAGEGDLRGEITYGCGVRAPFCFPPRLQEGAVFGPLLASGLNWGSYPRAKLANLYFAQELPKRSGVFAVSVHPGMVATPGVIMESDSALTAALSRMQDAFYALALRSAEVSARVVLSCARRDGGLPAGAHANGLGQAVPDHRLPQALADGEVARRLWDVTELHLERWWRGEAE